MNSIISRQQWFHDIVSLLKRDEEAAVMSSAQGLSTIPLHIPEFPIAVPSNLVSMLVENICTGKAFGNLGHSSQQTMLRKAVCILPPEGLIRRVLF